MVNQNVHIYLSFNIVGMCSLVLNQQASDIDHTVVMFHIHSVCACVCVCACGWFQISQTKCLMHFLDNFSPWIQPQEKHLKR